MPDETPEQFRERLASVGHVGRMAGQARVRDLDGRGRSFEIDLADGRMAGVVRPAPIRYRLSVGEGKVYEQT